MSMRAWTVVAAGLVAASASVSAAVLMDNPPAKQQQQRQKTPDGVEPGDEDPIIREVQRRVQVMGGPDVQIGVSIRDLEGEQAHGGRGAVVAGVRADSPAAKAGIKDGDVIVEFDGERVRSAKHLSRLVAETPTGRSVKVVVERDGGRVDLQVAPETARADTEFPMRRMPNREFEFNGENFRFDGPDMHGLFEQHGPGGPDVLIVPQGRGRLGIGIQDLSPQLAEYFGTRDGVLVTNVELDSPAAKAGLKAGDVITAIGDTQVGSPADLTRAVRRADEGAELSITYMRDKKQGTATAKLETREREPRRRGEPI